MANKIQIRRGLQADLPSLDLAEMGFTTDTKRIYIGDPPNGNILINIADYQFDLINGADGYLAFFIDANRLEGNENLFWDRVNNRLGIRTKTPTHALTVDGYITPAVDNAHCLGTQTQRWKSLYVGPGSLHLTSTSGETLTAFDWNVAIDQSSGNEGNLIIKQGDMLYMSIDPVSMEVSFPTATQLTSNGPIKLYETAAPLSESGYGKIYVGTSDHKLHFINNVGADVALGEPPDLSPYETKADHGLDIKALKDASDGYGRINSQQSTWNTTVRTALDGYGTPPDLSPYETKAAHGLDIKALVDATDGYGRINSQQSTWNSTVRTALDGYASASAAGTDGYVQYNNGGPFGAATFLYYDDINQRVGIGTVSPAQRLHVVGDGYFSTRLGVGTAPNSNKGLVISSDTVSTFSPFTTITDAVQLEVTSPYRAGITASTISRTSKIRMKSTFDNYPSDQGPRTTAQLVAGFSGGAWGTEYLAIGVGNNSSANDTGIDPLERIRIIDGGNVGIATTTPKNKLDIAGGAVIGSSYAGVNTAPSNGLLVQGNVAIGATSAAYTLDVPNGTTRTSSLISSYITINRNDPNIILDFNPTGSWGGNTKNYWLQSVRGSGSGMGPDGAFGLWNQTNSRTQWIITYDGKMGVGLNWTASVLPQSMLSVNGNASIGSTYSTTNAAPTDGLLVQGKVGIGVTSVVAGNLELPVNTTNSNIKVGALELQGYAVNNSWISDNLYWNGSNFVYRANGYAQQIYFYNAGFDFRISPNGSAGNTASQTVALRIDSSSRVGINNSSPSAALDVIGDLEVNGNIWNAALKTALDGYSSSITDLQRIDSQQSTWNNTVRTALDGYAGGGPTAVTAPNTGAIGDGYIAFFIDGSRQIAGDNDLFYDRATGNVILGGGGRLGIGTTPTYDIDMVGNLRISANTSSLIRMKELNGPSDEKNWNFQVGNSGILRYFVSNDADSSSAIWLEVNRTGITVDNIDFRTGSGTSAFYIDGSQRVGLGYSSLSNKLSINGGVSIGSSSSAPSNGLYVNGNVGCGISSPAGIFETSGSSSSVLKAAYLTNIAQDNNTTKSVSQVFRLTDTVGTKKESAAITVVPVDSNVIDANLIFSTRTSDGSPTEKMRITSAGYVGIGTNNPTRVLETYTSTGAYPYFTRATSDTNITRNLLELLHITSSDMVDELGSTIVFSVQDNSAVLNQLGRIGAARSGADNSGRLVFLTNNAGSLTEKMTIMPTGKIGISTSSPADIAHIYTTGSWDGFTLQNDRTADTAGGKISLLRTRSGGSASVNDIVGEFGFVIKDSTSTNTNVASIQSIVTNVTSGSVSGDLRFVTNNAGSWGVRAYLKSDGKFGIGTTSPTSTLDVVGDVEINGNIWNPALKTALDGYANAIADVQRTDSQQSGWNDTVRAALDGYAGGGAGALSKAEQYPINHALVQAADGYGTLFSQQSTWNNTVRAALDAYGTGGGTVTAAQGADGYLAFFTSANAIAGDNDLYWDRGYNRLGIGGFGPSNRPQYSLSAAGGIENKGDSSFLYAHRTSDSSGQAGVEIGVDINTRVVLYCPQSSTDFRIFSAVPGSGFDKAIFAANGDIGLCTTQGKLGIGTASPSYAVHVAQNSNSDVYYGFNNSNSGSSASSRLFVGSSGHQIYINAFGGSYSGSVAGESAADAAAIYPTGAAKFFIGTYDSAPVHIVTNNTKAITIDTNQKVGIGTSSPDWRLDVETSENTTAKFGANTPLYVETVAGAQILGFNIYNDGSNLKYGVGSSSNYGGVIGIDISNGGMYFQTTPSSGNADGIASFVYGIKIDKNGRVGINNGSPSATLDVIGDLEVNGNIWNPALKAALDGYSSSVIDLQRINTQQSTWNNTIRSALDGYGAPPDLSAYETKIEHGLDIKAIRDVIDGYALASNVVTMSMLGNSIPDIRSACDAYGVSISDLQRIDSQQTSWNSTVQVALDGYSTAQIAPGVLDGYELISSHNADMVLVREACDGYGRIDAQQSLWNNAVQAALDGYTGGGGSGPGNYVSQNFTSQTSVTVTHNLGHYPVVAIIDTDGYVFVPDTIEHTSVNEFTVTFAIATSGTILVTIGAGGGSIPTGALDGYETIAAHDADMVLVRSACDAYGIGITDLQRIDTQQSTWNSTVSAALDGYGTPVKDAPKYTITSSKTADYSANFDEIVRCDPSSVGFTITLPTASGGTGQTVIIKNTTSSSNIITIQGTGGELIDGQSSVTIAEGYRAITFVSYGSAWGRI